MLVTTLSQRARAKRAEGEAADLRSDRDTLARDKAGLERDLAAQTTRAERLPEVEAELTRIRDAYDAERDHRATLAQELKSTRESHEARLEELRGMKKDLEDRFSAIAGDVLKGNSETFLGMVSERFTAHNKEAAEALEKRQEAIRNLVKPLDEKLGKFDSRIGEIEKARNEAYGAIRTQVRDLAESQKTLGQETRRLVQALRAPKTRGRWGEMQLRQVFEMSGMAEHVDYVQEHSMETDAGRRRPDAIVHIPGGKSIVVDAKTPLEAYLDALEADSPEGQAAQLKRHAGHVKTHVKLLASKAYQEQIDETPDFVVMFIPGETFVSAAAEADPGLIEYAFENKVLIATPTTLMALIKAIAYGWQQEKMAENAVEVQRTARELYDRLSTFAGHLDKVGKSLRSSVDNYNRAVGSLETRVLPSARKFEQLGVVSEGADLAGPSAVEQDPRPVTAAEYTAISAE
ncbi:DNA recombination protein RmuC [Aquicoccus sp. SCR17]|nr:DNA recombination protein RmuC [Carideicomes alvinocaridis]